MKVSILVTHFSTDDYKSYVAEKCLTRLYWLAKSEKNTVPTEVIIVNNGKRDEDFKKYCDIYIQNEVNSLGGARNKAFNASSGEYVCFMDNDIYPEHRFWLECIQLLETYPDRKFIATPIYTSGHVYVRRHDKGYLDGHLLNNRTGSNCLFMRRSSFIDIGPFQENAPDMSGGGRVHYRGLEGVEFCDRQLGKGYLMILTRPSLARDVGFKLHNYAKRYNSNV